MSETGFQIHESIKARKSKIDELLKRSGDLNEGHALVYFSSLDECACEEAGKKLDAGDYDGVADDIRMHMAREVVRRKMKEVVRKKAGGGGYVLYSPNQGKKKQAKPVGTFPTKLGAKKAELARYPPKDQKKLRRLRREVDRLLKDPKKRDEKEKTASKQKGTDKSVEKHAHPKPKKESLMREQAERRLEFMHNRILSRCIVESLFREEKTGSEWDDYISRLSPSVLHDDKKFQNLQKNIEKKTHKILQDAFASIRKAVKKDVKLKDYGVKKADDGKSYLAFSAEMEDVEVGPIYVYVENGIPKLEVSDNAKVGFTKCDPDTAKMFRAELVTVQERVLDHNDELVAAIQNRDKYLTKVQGDVDSYVAGLTPLQVSLLKQLLVKKYRKTT